MMKVLYIASADYKYGVAKSTMSLMLYMKEHFDVEPVLLTKKHNKLNEMCDEEKIENYSCWYGDFMCGSPYSFFPLKIAKHIVKYILYMYSVCIKKKVFSCGIDFEQIDIVHTAHNRQEIGAYICKERKIPHVWHIREFGKEDYNVVFYKHNTIQYMNKYTDAFIAISDAVRECWIKKGLDECKIRTVYNGLSTKGFVPKERRKDELLKIVITGHIQPNKGQLQIVEAVALLPKEIQKKIQLDLIGDAYEDYALKIKKVIEKNQLENVNFLGYCKDVPKKLSEYDIGVVCSKAEGFGRVTVEYMLAGLYVVAADTGANPELIKSDKIGMLYKYGDIEDLKTKIQNIFYKNIRGRMDHTENEFSMEKYAKGVYDVYLKVLNNTDSNEDII